MRSWPFLLGRWSIQSHQKTIGTEFRRFDAWLTGGRRLPLYVLACLPSDKVLVAVKHLCSALLDFLGDPVAELVVSRLGAVAHTHLGFDSWKWWFKLVRNQFQKDHWGNKSKSHLKSDWPPPAWSGRRRSIAWSASRASRGTRPAGPRSTTETSRSLSRCTEIRGQGC